MKQLKTISQFGLFLASSIFVFRPLTSALGAYAPLEPHETVNHKIEIRPSSGDDDVEESADGTIYVDSSDLELGFEGENRQVVGIRFEDVTIPKGARISNAYIQFRVDEPNSFPASLSIAGQASNDAEPFGASVENITSRLLTAVTIGWNPDPWLEIGDAGDAQKTPDLTPIVQEIIDRPGWDPGNALVLIVSGSGSRPAKSYEGGSSSAYLLHIEYAGEAALAPMPHSTGNVTRFAVIGDYGTGLDSEAQVAELVASWDPDFIITTGDNNYPSGEAETIDLNIGQFYSQFIGDYRGEFGSGAEINRFWASLGNHDWRAIDCDEAGCTGPYFDYFTLPGNERYYDVDYGAIHLFALDTDSKEPDGYDVNSAQAAWLKQALAESEACFNIVYGHYPPYSSAHHGSVSEIQWPFEEWGADVVISGHDHTYERLDAAGFPFFVNGVGGAGIYDFENIDSVPPHAQSIVRYNEQTGAMLVTADVNGITYQFYNVNAELIDELIVKEYCEALDF
ncbi:MAG: hypothetical protein FJ010_08035 [Chloroflexi bacterium]|nr:hypothetical protein [Chloroflexota bacterium]